MISGASNTCTGWCPIGLSSSGEPEATALVQDPGSGCLLWGTFATGLLWGTWQTCSTAGKTSFAPALGACCLGRPAAPSQATEAGQTAKWGIHSVQVSSRRTALKSFYY